MVDAPPALMADPGVVGVAGAEPIVAEVAREELEPLEAVCCKIGDGWPEVYPPNPNPREIPTYEPLDARLPAFLDDRTRDTKSS